MGIVSDVLFHVAAAFGIAITFMYWLMVVLCFGLYKNGSLMFHPIEKEWQFWYGTKRVSNSVDVRKVRGKNVVIFIIKLIVQYKQVTR